MRRRQVESRQCIDRIDTGIERTPQLPDGAGNVFAAERYAEKCGVPVGATAQT